MEIDFQGGKKAFDFQPRALTLVKGLALGEVSSLEPRIVVKILKIGIIIKFIYYIII